MLGGFFKSREIDRFAHDLSERLAPGLVNTSRSRRDGRALDALIDDVEARAVAFSREHGLGVYGKARLCRTLGECLEQAGTEPQVREAVVRRYLVRNASAKA